MIRLTTISGFVRRLAAGWGGRVKKSSRASMLGVMVLMALVLSGVSNRADAQPCGPGPDWVDRCQSGTDRFPSYSEHGIVIFDPEDGGFIVNLPRMFGNAEVFRGNPIGPNPFRIETEMVSLLLTGGGFTLKGGDGVGNLLRDGPLFSPGRITEQGTGIGATFADSFFDIFFELSPTPFGVLHNIDPCTMTGMPPGIDRVPPLPGTEYDGCSPRPTIIDLYDSLGIHRAILTGDVRHVVDVPEPSTFFLLGSGLMLLAGWGRKRMSVRVARPRNASAATPKMAVAAAFTSPATPESR